MAIHALPSIPQTGLLRRVARHLTGSTHRNQAQRARSSSASNYLTYPSTSLFFNISLTALSQARHLQQQLNTPTIFQSNLSPQSFSSEHVFILESCKSELWGNLAVAMGWGAEGGSWGRAHMWTELIHFTVQQKPAQCCKATTPPI